jgi:nitrate reductase NapE component
MDVSGAAIQIVPMVVVVVGTVTVVVMMVVIIFEPQGTHQVD